MCGEVVAVGGGDVGHREDAVVVAVQGVMVVMAVEGGAAVVIAVAIVMLFAGHAEAHDVAVVVVRDGRMHHRQQKGQRDEVA